MHWYNALSETLKGKATVTGLVNFDGHKRLNILQTQLTSHEILFGSVFRFRFISLYQEGIHVNLHELYVYKRIWMKRALVFFIPLQVVNKHSCKFYGRRGFLRHIIEKNGYYYYSQSKFSMHLAHLNLFHRPSITSR